MSSIWALSMDSVVTILIVVGISGLGVAWLFAGGRRPKKVDSLEQRRLAGREAEVAVATAAPSFTATQDLEEAFSDDPFETPDPSVIVEEPDPAPIVEPSKTETPTPTLALSKTQVASQQAAAVDPVDEVVAPPSPKKESALAITAALLRRDKRTAPTTSTATEVELAEPVGAGGDDLTAIEGIDAKLAKELNDLGLHYYDQIIDLSPGHAEWIASRLSVPVDAAQRKAWVAEAKNLVAQTTPVAQSLAGQRG